MRNAQAGLRGIVLSGSLRSEMESETGLETGAGEDAEDDRDRENQRGKMARGSREALHGALGFVAPGFVCDLLLGPGCSGGIWATGRQTQCTPTYVAANGGRQGDATG